MEHSCGEGDSVTPSGKRERRVKTAVLDSNNLCNYIEVSHCKGPSHCPERKRQS